MGSIGTVGGTFLVPGLSANNRLYQRTTIAGAVAQMQERIADPNGLPITMLSHHAAEDDSTRICGRVTDVALDDAGRATFRAAVPDTEAGRTMLELTKPGLDGRRFLDSVSIRGYWTGDVRQEEHEGKTVTTCDSLEVDGIDYTRSPGVSAARLESVRAEKESAESTGRVPITESVTVEVTEVEPTTEADDPKKPYGSVTYADSGFQSDGVKRYPLSDPGKIRSAWSYINQDKNAAKYTASQLATIKSRIKAAAKKAGIQISGESAASVHDQLAESVAALEAMVGVSAMQGPADVDVRAYGVDNADVAAATALVGQAAAAALLVLDPDQDDDLDIPGATDGDDPDGDAVPPVCGACATELPDDALFCPGCGTHVGSTESFSTPDQEVTEMGPTKCGGCKSDVPADAKFCPNCGANTKTKDGGPESAPSGQEGHVAETQGLSESDRKAIVDDLAAQLKATLAPATETAVASGDGATESAGDTTTAASAATTTEAASATDIASIIAAEVAKVRDEAAAARETDRTAMIAAFGQTMTAERDTWRKEALETSGGPRRKGLLERVHALSEADDTPLHTLPAHERTKRHQQNIADQFEMAGAHPEIVASIRTEHSA